MAIIFFVVSCSSEQPTNSKKPQAVHSEKVEAVESTVQPPTTNEIENSDEQKTSKETELSTTVPTKDVEKNEIKAEPFNHSAFDELLNAFVTIYGDVNYDAFKTKHQKLKEYISLLEKNTPQDTWSRNQKLAYWINAYNAHTINLILNHYPVNSITDISSGKPWDEKIIKVGTETYSLNQVENEIIRPTFKEPRIHFAVNCAAKSCPKILNAAFDPKILDEQLESQTKLFINNGSKNVINKDKIEISKIFEWYKGDFETDGSLITFLNLYSKTKIDSQANISFMEYDWALNK